MVTIRKLQAAERAAKDTFWPAVGPSGTKVTTEQRALWAALTRATKARQAAQSDFAASLVA